MGKLLIAACAVVCACQPMYGQKAPKLKDPKPIVHKEEATPAPPIVYVNDCNADFSAPPTKKRQTAASQQLVVAGDTTLTQNTTDDRAKVEAVRHGIDIYIDALKKDPYNPE